MRARTFDLETGEAMVVEILSRPSSTGLVKVGVGDRVLVRHVARLEPLDAEAEELLSGARS